MSRPDSSLDEKGVNQNGGPGGHRSVFTDTHTSAVSPETKLLSAFKKDTEAKKVYLAGRGESAHFIKLFVCFPSSANERRDACSTTKTCCYRFASVQ